MNVGSGTESAGERSRLSVLVARRGRDTDLRGVGHRGDPYRDTYLEALGRRFCPRQRHEHRRCFIALSKPDIQAHLEADPIEALDPAWMRLVERMRLDHEVVRAYQMAIECGHRTQEAHHELGCRVIVKLVRRPDLLDASLVDHHDPICDVQRLFLIMGDEDRRDMYLVVQPAQPSSQLFADIGIQGAERLVQAAARWARSRGREPAPCVAVDHRKAEPAVGRRIATDAPERVVH